MQFDLIESGKPNRSGYTREMIAGFLSEHLDEYGDSPEAILNCIAYARGDGPGQSGFIILAHDREQIRGAAIVNDTNMSGYIPEHILVYIAVAKDSRGRGVGKALMEKVINRSEGEIALHVEPENPARRLYESYGFTYKYLEMRRPR